jgi:NAD(P)-dependent dehydrogenase (short-subunit alcohol dehydrogenase family)
MLKDLNGNVAIITGAGRGIGKDIALRLAGEGCCIVAVSRTVSELEKTVDEIKDKGGKAIAVVADLSNKNETDRLISRSIEHFQKIDILINNAAVLFSSPFTKISEEQWDVTMNVNLKAAFLLSQKVLKVMEKQKSGYIINISSTAAFCVPPVIAAYGISKLGMAGLTQALYETAKKSGVKVSIIYPGMTDTQMLRGFNPPVDPGKWMLPEDIADCVVFLLKLSDRVIVKELTPWAVKHDKI